MLTSSQSRGSLWTQMCQLSNGDISITAITVSNYMMYIKIMGLYNSMACGAGRLRNFQESEIENNIEIDVDKILSA